METDNVGVLDGDTESDLEGAGLALAVVLTGMGDVDTENSSDITGNIAGSSGFREGDTGACEYECQCVRVAVCVLE